MIKSFNRAVVYNNVYILSYICLMISSLIGVYSEFSTTVYPMPLFVKMIWYLGLAIFLSSQCMLLILNGINVNRYVIPIAVLLYLLGCLTLVGFPVVKLRTFVLILLILNINLVEMKEFIKIDFLTRAISLFFIFALYILNIFPTKYEEMFTRPDGTHRYAWGFVHPNTLGEFYLYFLISIILLLNSKYSIYKMSIKNKCMYSLLIFITGAYVEFFVTNSRSSQISLIVILIGWIVCALKDTNCLKSIYGVLTLFLMTIFSIIFDYKIMMNDKLFFHINDLFSNRLVLQNQALLKYGIHIFGNKNVKVGHPFWIDNQYIYNFLALGIIGAIIYILIFCMAFKNTYKNNDFMLYVILVAIVIKGMFESTVFEYSALLPIVYAFRNVKWNESTIYMNIYNRIKGVLK